MLTVYRRHSLPCKAKLRAKGLSPEAVFAFNRCNCACWLQGVDPKGLYHRETLGTRDWVVANEYRRNLELGVDAPKPAPASLPLSVAWSRHIDILTSQRGIKPQSIAANQGPTRDAMIEWFEGKSVHNISDLTPDLLDECIASWKLSTATRRIRILVLRQFLKTAHAKGWVQSDLAAGIHKPKYPRPLTDPFNLVTEDPLLIATLDRMVEFYRASRRCRSVWAQNVEVGVAVVYVMRYLGLRISDALMFNPSTIERREVEGETVYTYSTRQKKTGEHVFLPIKAPVAERILSAPRLGPIHAFWDGQSDMKGWVREFQEVIVGRLGVLSGVPHVHAHRFRDTFAVELLSKGVDIRSVSRLLGHTSVSTTLRYYERFIPADQERLIRTVMQTW